MLYMYRRPACIKTGLRLRVVGLDVDAVYDGRFIEAGLSSLIDEGPNARHSSPLINRRQFEFVIRPVSVAMIISRTGYILGPP